MTEPKIVNRPECPSCSGTEWKLAKMIVLDGTINVDTESDGGGFGASAGLGRGQGGANLNYQSLNFSTTGTHTRALAEALAPPPAPPQYAQKDYWLCEMRTHLRQPAQNVVEIDRFALDQDKLKPGIFNTKVSEPRVEHCKKRYLRSRAHLVEILKFEKRFGIWEKTRVCNRCGETYVLNHDILAYIPSFDIPEFKFKGQERKCPGCASYCWKRADIFFPIKRNELEKEIMNRESALEEALEFERNPEADGFWSKLGKNLFTLKPEQAKSRLKEVTDELEELNRKMRDLQVARGDLNGIRICLSCESPYQLP